MMRINIYLWIICGARINRKLAERCPFLVPVEIIDVMHLNGPKVGIVLRMLFQPNLLHTPFQGGIKTIPLYPG